MGGTSEHVFQSIASLDPPFTVFRSIAQLRFSVHFEPTDPVLRLCFRLCEKYLDSMTKEDILQCLANRIDFSLVEQDFWASAEVRDAMDSSDLKMIDKHEESKIKGDDDLQGLDDLRDEIKSKGGAQPSHGEAAEPRPGTHRGSIDAVPVDIDAAFANLHCPEGWRCFKSVKDNRWRVSHKNFPATSKTWTLHGVQGSLALCLKHCWSWELKVNKKQCPYKWINDV